MSNRIANLLNIQHKEACMQEIACKETTPERELILNLCEEVNILNERINNYNRLPLFKRLFKEI